MAKKVDIKEKLKLIVRKTIEELGLEEGDHPQLRNGEIFVGQVEYTKILDSKEHELYSNAWLTGAIQFLSTIRIGEKEVPVGDRPVYDYSRPVFTQKTEYYEYIMANCSS